MEKDISTEEKIREAARKIFHQKGYAATRTRDIAEEAGINLALLNYYFRSKEKLFEMVMAESFHKLFVSIRSVIVDNDMTLSQKIDAIVATYTDMLIENPNLPIFVLGEIQANPDRIKEIIRINSQVIIESPTFQQVVAQLEKIGMKGTDPFHLVLNMLSMTLFPFIGKPVIQKLTEMDNEDFLKFVHERRMLVPLWIKGMLQLSN